MANDLIGVPARGRDRRGGSAIRGTSRRLAAVACLTVTASLTYAPVVAHAEPKPTRAQVQKKLDKLGEQMDHKVEQFNQLNEKLKIAKKKYDSATKASKQEQATFEEQRTAIAKMAAAAYKNGDSADVTGFVGSNDPQAILDQAAVFSHLSQERSSQLTQFLATAQRLRREEAQAKAAYDDVKAKTKELREQKQKLDKEVAKQKALLRRLGGGTSSGGGGGIGGTYTGPASGSARTALNFAYAQLGKPYSYGAEGPNSYDCSGLTMKAWGAAGVSITRTTNSQYAATKRVAKSALQEGDLVFFNSLGHVGIYVGGGKMIHAPRTGKNVEIVSITSGYYLSNYYGAGRP
ncbi:C40 family peptidase [Actinomadura madurae]|uniref:C40 family peptidase n=1 Tax=Actinomadura madurae TaxID=1993 RepID=UPI0020D21703|nr:C40 family peptidase [Actinomadura madurae]MCP9954813.1 NlpC/P60 family protein [Actinomadura madurae]MCP9971556.1 NlpC/P60 family protein [Actinomadura madurae]MCQ0004388.1 NlpC/P60 family protein [Actinomadura madurae]MCQ0020277.1 NlpC/P60 family protein [Actinomadura madurae]